MDHLPRQMLVLSLVWTIFLNWWKEFAMCMSLLSVDSGRGAAYKMLNLMLPYRNKMDTAAFVWLTHAFFS